MATMVNEIMRSESILLYLFAYTLGSVPVGLLLVRWKDKKDVRQIGSGNIGAVNVMRSSGKILGLTVLILDILKGYIAVLVARSFHEGLENEALVGMFALIGHCFPVWLGFLGGKGVATGFGVLLALSPFTAGIGFMIFSATFILSKIPSLASLLAAISVLFAGMFFINNIIVKSIVAAMVVLVLWRHRLNISRLFSGQEPTL